MAVGASPRSLWLFVLVAIARGAVGGEAVAGEAAGQVVFADGLVRVEWWSRREAVSFRVVAATRGYVGLGFSARGGGMAGADLALFWVHDETGRVHLEDCHATHNGAPLKDSQQDFILESGFQNDTHTVVRFRRAWVTCGPVGEDVDLGNDTIRMLWAYRDEDPVNGELLWHGSKNRGVKSVHLRTPPPAMPDSVKTSDSYWDVKMDGVIIPDDVDTLYWCKMFKAPKFKEKHHMIGYTPVLEAGNDRHVHHMLLYQCSVPKQSIHSAQMLYDKHIHQSGAACYSPKMPHEWETCITPVVAWGIGSQGEFLPEHVGLPIGEDGSDTYFMLEIHYDNPSFEKLHDSSGVRIHYTSHLRPYDGGILVNGITVTPLHLIPPHQEHYTNVGFCSSECTRKMFPAKGVHIISVLLHSHLAGRKMRLRHLRGGKELHPIVEDNSYDFNYQQTRSLAQEVEVLPGDELVTECVYETINRSEPTFGGYSTKEEMCLAFITYYPRTSLAACYSMAPVQFFFETVGVKEFYEKDMDTVEKLFLKLGDFSLSKKAKTTPAPPMTLSPTPLTSDGLIPEGGGHIDDEINQRAIEELKKRKGYTLDEGESVGGSSSYQIFEDLVIKQPLEFSNKSFSRHLQEVPWAEELLTRRIEHSFRYGQHMTFCRMQNDQLPLPEAIQNFPNVTEKRPSEENILKSVCGGTSGLFLDAASAGKDGSPSRAHAHYHHLSTKVFALLTAALLSTSMP
ncbi:MOXD1 homolog 1-like [Ischnura elegans]|uniref:MOXD1 homolog 1-like n=1 Tax=Ischnura elegans TaxID=197161 RepID=UPI001ED8BF6B|nr:MOXD1 homolog 1-like [Ischnura elegans]